MHEPITQNKQLVGQKQLVLYKGTQPEQETYTHKEIVTEIHTLYMYN